jgi:tetratricopeptide (TPR) repeat protein
MAAIFVIITFIIIGMFAFRILRRMNATTYYNRGSEAERRGIPHKAERQYRRAIRSNPHDTKTHTSLGRLLYDLKRYKEAKREFENVLGLNPSDNIARDYINRINDILSEIERSRGAREPRQSRRAKESSESRRTGSIEEIKVKVTSPDIDDTDDTDVTIERTIYDPTKGFIISRDVKLPNVEEWIKIHDPSMYWFILCINNESEGYIDKWGIELDVDSLLDILETRIEGYDGELRLKELSYDLLDDRTRYGLSIPQKLGLVIPKNGSKRIYLKLVL